MRVRKWSNQNSAAFLQHLTLKFKKVTLHYRSSAAKYYSSLQHEQTPYCCCCCCSSHGSLYQLPAPPPSHFVVMATLTLNSQVGWCWGRDTETVARTAGVLPSILRLDPEDDKGAVDENAHSELQIAARRHRRFITACYWSTPTGQGTHLWS